MPLPGNEGILPSTQERGRLALTLGTRAGCPRRRRDALAPGRMPSFPADGGSATYPGAARECGGATAGGVRRAGVPGLLYVRHPGSGAAASGRRAQAGAAPHRLRHERIGAGGHRQAAQERQDHRRRDRQVSPAWRCGLLRGHGAPGAAVRLPPPAGGRPRQFRRGGRSQVICRHALHGSAANRLRANAAGGAGAGHG